MKNFIFLIGAACTGLALAGTIAAVEIAPSAKEDATAKIAEITANLEKQKRAELNRQSAKIIADLRAVTGISEEAAAALQPAMDRAVADAAHEFTEKYIANMRKMFGESADKAFLKYFEQASQNFARQRSKSDFLEPELQPAWKEALQHSLTAEQAAAWQAEQGNREKKLWQDLAKYLDAQEGPWREAASSSLQAPAALVKMTLPLAPERVTAVEALLKGAVDEAIKAWREREEANLHKQGPETLRGLMADSRRGLQFSGPSPVQAAQELWKSGLDKFLTPEEQAQIKAAEEGRRTRRVQALGNVLIACLDEQVGFTKDQRRRLGPIAEDLVKEDPFCKPVAGELGPVQFGAYWEHGAKAKISQLRPILDEAQIKRWQEACNPKEGLNQESGSAEGGNEENEDPEEAELLLSAFLDEHASREREQVLAAMRLKAEDAARVVHLETPAKERLRTAALGAVDLALAGWKEQENSFIRGNMGEVQGMNMRQRLLAMEGFQFNNQLLQPEKAALWRETVKVELTAEQRLAWEAEVAERAAFHDLAVANLLLETFASKLPLTPEQRDKLGPQLAKIVGEYGSDCNTFYSSSPGSPWFLQAFTMMWPFAGVPEAEIKNILTKEQYDLLKRSPEITNGSNFWEGIRQNHEMRVKNEQQ